MNQLQDSTENPGPDVLTVWLNRKGALLENLRHPQRRLILIHNFCR
jgi:hypothetical protein